MTTALAAPLPDLDLASFVTLTVDAGDPNAVITAFTIHVSQTVPDTPETISLIPPILAHLPTK